MKNYTFVKNVKGGLSFSLDSYDLQLPSRTFTIASNVNQIAIPEPYALGLFISSDALDMYQRGYFMITEIKDLKNKAKENGLYVNIDEEPVYTIKEIEKIVITNDKKGVENIINRHKKVEFDNLVAIAREHIDSLNSGTIDKIEEACGAELRIG